MKLFGRPISDWFRACGACGRAYGPIDFFCDRCWAELYDRANRGARLRQESYDALPTYALWTWTRQNEIYLRPLIYALKGGWGPPIARRLAEDLAMARASLPLQQKKFTVAMPPRRLPAERDHAWRLASGFAESSGAPLWDGLAASGDQEAAQKTKTARERRELRFVTPEPIPAAEAWMFVDDVVTTGATSLAAHRALVSPEKFEVWALAARPRQ